MCNFGGQGHDLPHYYLVAQASFGLKVVRGRPLIQIVPNGSFFDPVEVPPLARREILSLVRSSGFVEEFETESRLEYVSERVISEAKELLGDIVLDVGIGLESSSPLIRELVINKGTRQEDYARFVDLSRKMDFKTTFHVLLKPAFLTESEAVEDCVRSIEYAVDLGASYVVLMVSNLREYTLNYWLWERGLYKLPMLWTLLEVLMRLDKKYLDKVLVAGFVSNETLLKPAENCPHCTNPILSKLRMFQYTRDESFLREAYEYQCSCKEMWKRRMGEKEENLFPERILRYYKFIALNLFGREWLSEREKEIERYVEGILGAG